MAGRRTWHGACENSSLGRIYKRRRRRRSREGGLWRLANPFYFCTRVSGVVSRCLLPARSPFSLLPLSREISLSTNSDARALQGAPTEIERPENSRARKTNPPSQPRENHFPSMILLFVASLFLPLSVPFLSFHSPLDDRRGLTSRKDRSKANRTFLLYQYLYLYHLLHYVTFYFYFYIFN